MARLTRRGREIEEAKGNVPSPLKYLPASVKPKKLRGNATAASQSTLKTPVAQQPQVETTSASQSPQSSESRSQSPPVAESRSTSPPAQHTRSYSTRAASASLSASRSLSVEPERAAAAAQTKKVAKKPHHPRGKKAAAIEVPTVSESTRKIANTKSRAKTGASRTRSKATSSQQRVDRSTSQSLQLPGSFPTHDGDVSLPSIEGSDHHISASNSTRAKRTRQESSTHQGADSTDDENTRRSIKRRRNETCTSPSQEPQYCESSHEAHSSQISATRSRQYPPSPRARSKGVDETPSQTGQFINDISIDFDDSNAAFSTPKDFFRSKPKLSMPDLPEAEEETEIQEQIISESNADKQRSADVCFTPTSKALRQANFTCPPRSSTLADDFDRSGLTPGLGLTRTLQKPHRQVNNLFYDPKFRRESFNIEYDSDDEGVKDAKGYTHQELHEYNNKMKALNRQYRMKGASDIFPLVQAPFRATPKSMEVVNKKSERGPSPVHSRPSTSISESSLVIPASASQDRMILTDLKIIDAVRSLALWASSNPTSTLPDPEQMTALLEYHQSKDLDKVSVPGWAGNESAAALPTTIDIANDHVSDKTVTSHKVVNAASDAQDVTMSGGLGNQPDIVTDDASEVQEFAEPITPFQPKSEPKPSGWFSSFGALVKTPINLLRGRQQAAGSTPTNAQAEIEVTSRHSSTFSQQPTTPTQSKSFKPRKAQSERKHSRLSNTSRVPREPIRVDRFKDKSLPIEQRGLISEKRIKEIQDEQDAKAEKLRLANEDPHASERQKLRNKYQTSIEEVAEEEHNYDQPTKVSTAVTGDKRKHKDLAETPKPEKRGFSAPSPTSSDSDNDDNSGEGHSHNKTPSRNQDKTPSKGQRTPFDLSTIDEESENSSYYIYPRTGRVFQQPPLVQANINRGASPISLKNSLKLQAELDAGSSNLFGRLSPNNTIQKKKISKRPAAPLPTKQGYGYDIDDPYYWDSDDFSSDEEEVAPAPSTSRQSLRGPNDGSAVDNTSTNESLRGPNDGSTGTFSLSPSKSVRGMNDGFAIDNTSTNKSLQGPNGSSGGLSTKSVRGKNDGSSVDNILIDESLRGPNGAIVDDSTTVPALQEANSVLQQKQWQQTPPPKAPRPSNAELPQTLPPSAADIALAKVNKHQPKQPSGLRYVKNMSPLQLEQQRLSMVLKENDTGGSVEAIEAVQNLGDEYVTQLYFDADDKDTTMKDYSDLTEACEIVDNLKSGFA